MRLSTLKKLNLPMHAVTLEAHERAEKRLEDANALLRLDVTRLEGEARKAHGIGTGRGWGL